MSLNLRLWRRLPAWSRKLTRVSLQVVVWGTGLTILSAVLLAALLPAPQGIHAWLENARFPLLVWRLALYGALAGVWFGGIRSTLTAQIREREDRRALSSLRRLEVMTLTLMALAEYNVWLAPH